MNEIENALEAVYKATDILRERMLPYDKILRDAKFKPVAEQGISERIMAAKLILAIKKI